MRRENLRTAAAPGDGPMSANRLMLVCSHCREIESSLLIAERADGDAQYTSASMKRADDWFAKHQRCGKGIDHYQLAYHRPLDWDLAPEAQHSVAGGVRLAIINGGEPK
jgi:hypothetical protein